MKIIGKNLVFFRFEKYDTERMKFLPNSPGVDSPSAARLEARRVEAGDWREL
jgi:hypothetical protein